MTELSRGYILFGVMLIVSMGMLPPFASAGADAVKDIVLADQVDFWQPYQTLLGKYLSRTEKEGIELTVLDYPAIKRDPAFTKMVDRLERFSTPTLKPGPDALAFWINAYNFLAVKLVVEHYPVESIKDIGSLFTSVWKKDAGKIGGKEYTLNEIEHDILRKQFNEPRIHFAIVCASLSCPNLRKEVYLPGAVYGQLDDNTGEFLRNPAKGVRPEGDHLVVSKIFDWFEDDFTAAGGVKAFILKYRPDLDPVKEYKIEYLPYNWDLNEKP